MKKTIKKVTLQDLRSKVAVISTLMLEIDQLLQGYQPETETIDVGDEEHYVEVKTEHDLELVMDMKSEMAGTSDSNLTFTATGTLGTR